jgi:hypothetical protein
MDSWWRVENHIFFSITANNCTVVVVQYPTKNNFAKYFLSLVIVWRNCEGFIVENPACEETKSTMSMDSPLDNLFLEDLVEEVLVPHTKRRLSQSTL